MPRAHDEPAAAGSIGRADAAAPHDDAARREVRALDVGHEVGERRVGVVEHADARADHLAQVVRRDVRRHADGDAGGAVDQQVREAARQNTRLLAALVEVRVPIDGVLLEVAEHLVGDLRQARLRVTVGRGRVAIDGAEVAVAVDEHIAHGEVLRQTHERVIDRRVAVRMVAAEHVAHAGGGLFERAVARQVVLIHRVENAAMDGLETVAHVGQRAPDDDGHGVFNIGFLHLRHQRGLDNMLVRITDLLGIILGFLTHIVSSLNGSISCLTEFAPAGAKNSNRFSRRRVRREKHCSDCKCGVLPPASKRCAQQAASHSPK